MEGYSLKTKAFTKLMISESKRAGQKPPTSNEGTIQAASMSMSALMTKVNRPKVRRFKGRVRKRTKGLMVRLMSPRTKATPKELQNELTWTQGKYMEPKKMTTAVSSQTKTSLMIFS